MNNNNNNIYIYIYMCIERDRERETILYHKTIRYRLSEYFRNRQTKEDRNNTIKTRATRTGTYHNTKQHETYYPKAFRKHPRKDSETRCKPKCISISNWIYKMKFISKYIRWKRDVYLSEKGLGNLCARGVRPFRSSPAQLVESAAGLCRPYTSSG